MLKAVKGRFRNGAVELYEKPNVPEGNVIITFLESDSTETVNLAEKGINREEAGNLRSRLLSFEEDWNSEGMELYDRL